MAAGVPVLGYGRRGWSGRLLRRGVAWAAAVLLVAGLGRAGWVWGSYWWEWRLRAAEMRVGMAQLEAKCRAAGERRVDRGGHAPTLNYPLWPVIYPLLLPPERGPLFPERPQASGGGYQISSSLSRAFAYGADQSPRLMWEQAELVWAGVLGPAGGRREWLAVEVNSYGTVRAVICSAGSGLAPVPVMEVAGEWRVTDDQVGWRHVRVEPGVAGFVVQNEQGDEAGFQIVMTPGGRVELEGPAGWLQRQ